MSLVQIHFDGPIAHNHQVSMRTLGKTLVHLQNAFDRACLEHHNGVLWKHAKIPNKYYKDVELLVQEPREGGYVLDFLTSNATTKKIIDRVASAIKAPYEQSILEGISATHNLAEDVNKRKIQIEKGLITPKDYQTLVQNPDIQVTRRYADRAIVREVDQVLSIIRSSNTLDSTFELYLSGEKSSVKFNFNKLKSKTFHSVISRRSTGDPVLYSAEVQSLDKHNLNGKIKNAFNNKIANIIFSDEPSLKKVIPYFESGNAMSFYGCPFIEYGAFDPEAGDIIFVDLLP